MLQVCSSFANPYESLVPWQAEEGKQLDYYETAALVSFSFFRFRSLAAAKTEAEKQLFSLWSDVCDLCFLILLSCSFSCRRLSLDPASGLAEIHPELLGEAGGVSPSLMPMTFRRWRVQGATGGM